MPSPMDKVRRDVQVNIVDKLNTQVFYIGITVCQKAEKEGLETITNQG